MSGRSLQMRAVSFGYDVDRPVVEGIDLSIGPGITLLVGPNGSGKSTLLKLAAGVERPDGGSVALSGHDLWKDEVAARRDLAYLPEEPDLTPYASVVEVLRLVCHLRREPTAAVASALARAGLEDLGSRSVRELSQGQRRRALMAAAWIGAPRTLMLDEPLDAMDQGMRGRIVEWLAEIRETGGLAIVVSHEIEPFAALADHAVAVRAGKVRWIANLPPSPEERLRLLRELAGGDPPAG